MRSALTLVAWRQVARHKARSALTIATMAVAVAGVWIFVTPNRVNAAMEARVETDQIHDVILRPEGVVLDPAAVERLRDVPNVDAVATRVFYSTEMRSGDQLQRVVLVGVDDFARQEVNRVRVDEGSAAGPGEALTDPQNARTGRFDGNPGDVVSVVGVDGRSMSLTVSGVGSTLYYSNWVGGGVSVLYVPVATVQQLRGSDELTRVELRLGDRSDEVADATVAAVVAELDAIDPSIRYGSLPEVRPDGEWPGEDEFDNFFVLFWTVGAISLLSAMVLIASTMNTLIREQRRVIGIMKALGGRRRAVTMNFALTALLLGSAATVFGIALGIPLSNALVGFLGRQLTGAELEWGISWLGIGLSVIAGVGGAVLASIPALRQVVRIPVHDALGTPGIESAFGQSALERGVRHAPLPRQWQLGLRAVVRRKARSATTVLQVALAVGTMLAFTSAALTMIWVSEQSRLAEGGDIQIWSAGASGSVVDDDAAELVAGVDGVDRVQPIVGIDARVSDTDTFVWGLPADPVYRYELGEGRWFEPAEVAERAQIAVVGPAIADIAGLEVDGEVSVETESGTVRLTVVGIDGTMVGDGKAVFMPLDSAAALRGLAEPDQLWVTTDSSDHAEIDTVNLAIRDALAGDGYGVDTRARYIDREAERASDRAVIAVILSMGVPVMAIGMIGLVSTMATNILERRREIGVLRSIGARARDIRRVFRSEATVLVCVGWLLGIGVGWLLGRLLMGTINRAFHVSWPLRYPWWSIAVALVVSLAVAAAALARPLARASRLPPSDALRYQ